MAIGPMSFRRIGFEEANPFMQGALKSQEIAKNALMTPQELQAAMLANMIAKAQAQYAEPTAKAEMEYKQAQTPYLQSQTQRQQIQNQYLPEQLRLGNENVQLTNQYMGPKFELEKTKQALANNIYQLDYDKQKQELLNPGLKAPGVAGQLEWARIFREQGREDEAKAIETATQKQQMATLTGAGGQLAEARRLEAEGNYADAKIIRDSVTNKVNNNAQMWRGMPADAKRNLLAWAKALKYDEAEATQAFQNGTTLADLAERKGLTLEELQNNYSPIFAPTQSTLTQIQKRESAIAVVDSLNDKITEWMVPYISKANFGNYSAKDAYDLISQKTDNKDERAKFIAASILYPELSGERGKALGLNMGITSLRHLEESGLADLKPIKNFDPETWQKAQKLVKDAITESAQKANEISYNPGLNKNLPKEETGKKSEEQLKIKIGDEATYPKEVQEKLKILEPNDRKKISKIAHNNGVWEIWIGDEGPWELK